MASDILASELSPKLNKTTQIDRIYNELKIILSFLLFSRKKIFYAIKPTASAWAMVFFIFF